MFRILLLLPLLSCGKKAEDTGAAPAGWQPDVFCPGGEGCAAVPGAPLKAGVAVRSVVPSCYESWEDLDDDAVYDKPGEAFFDCGCDQLCPGDPGYVSADTGEGDGVFQAAYLAGFQNNRPATGVRGAGVGLRGENDGLWARAVVLEQGETALALVAIDAIGWMYDDVQRMRADIAAAGVPVDHVIIHSSHVHEGPDTMGIYGPTLTITGYSSEYASQTADAVVEAVTEAWEGRVEASPEVGVVDATGAWSNGVNNLVRDSRDPFIVDPRVGVARFVDGSGGTVATLVHFANHPETVADENTLMTSDFAHALRETVESGVTWETTSRSGVGGTCVFVNGAVGGMMTSLGANVVDPDGVERGSASFNKADAVGQLLGELALDALDGATPVADPQLSFKASQIHLPVENQGFQVMFELGVFAHRSVHNYDAEQLIGPDNMPDVQTEVGQVALGPLELLTIPGELLPELAIGGYDGSFTPPGVDLVESDNPNPPDLSAAPEGPYLHDRMSGGHKWIVGLGNDELGYIIPPYDFVLDDGAPWFGEADGDHYEETNSLGPQTAPLIEEAVTRLLEWEL